MMKNEQRLSAVCRWVSMFLMTVLCVSVAFSAGAMQVKPSRIMETAITEEQWMNDYEAYASGFSAELLEELAKRDQAIPEYAASFDACTDPNKLYILPDGYVYEYLPRFGGSNMRNELLFATDDKGNAYNMGLGYMDHYRYSTSAQKEVADSASDVTGFIPVSPGDVVRFRNLDTFSLDASTDFKVIFFDWAYDYVTCSDSYTAIEDFSDSWVVLSDEMGQLIECIIPYSYNPDIYYMRVVAHDIRPDSILTVNELIDTNDIILDWCRVANAIEKKVVINQQSQKEKPASKSKKNNLEEFANLPDYWLEHLEAKSDQIRQLMEKTGRNKSAFLWYTDAHWNMNARKSPDLLRYLNTYTPINKTVYGGDIVYLEPAPEEISDRSVMEYLWDWRAAIRKLPHHHSVAGKGDNGIATDDLFTNEYVYAYLMAPEECSDIVRGGDFYYYIDDVNEKTRYLYLDTAVQNILDDQDQQSWLKQALFTTPDGWHIVAFAHVWLNMDNNRTPPAVIGPSYGGRVALELFDKYNSRQEEFATCGAKVEFCLGGHSHIDTVYHTTGGIPVITTETDSRDVRSGLPRDRETINENAVNAVIVDYADRNIHIVRVGRGDDMTVPF